MNVWHNIYRAIILFIGVTAIAFNMLLYNFCERQKDELGSIRDKQDVESGFNSTKFKYQQDQIERLSEDLEESKQQIRDQKEVLLQEAEKRQQIEDENKSIQNSLVDIKAEVGAVKQGIKGSQKDYLSILAAVEKKMDDSQNEIKSVKKDLASFEKMAPPPDNDLTNTLPTDDKKIESAPSESHQ